MDVGRDVGGLMTPYWYVYCGGIDKYSIIGKLSIRRAEMCGPIVNVACLVRRSYLRMG